MTPRKRRLATFAVFAASLAILVSASRTQGNVRDEGYYFDAAEEYANWYVDLVGNVVHGHASKSLSRAGIDHGFSYNHEHPALMKTLFGLSWRLFHKCHCPEQAGRHPIAYPKRHHTLNLLDEETAFRLPTMVLVSVMIACVFLFGLELSFGAGFAAAGMTLFASRFFFDAQLACFDAPIAAMWVIVTYAYWRGRTSKRWSIAAGVLVGMALAIKHNAFFLAPTLIAHWLIVDRKDIVAAFRARRLPLGDGGLRPLLWMGALFLPVYLACWPWLWYDTFHRFNEYASFHLHHVYYNFEYLGTNYNKPPFPWSFVFVMTLVTVPATTLVLAAFGLRQWIRDAKSGEASGICSGRCGLGTLVALNAAAPMLVLVLTRQPIFGATKHFHASIPFIALLAAYLVARITTAIPRVAFALPLVVVLPSAIDCARAHPYGLAHYTAFVGGPAGGAMLGMNRGFWGYATRGLLPWINQHAPRNARIYWHDTNQAQINMYVREGYARPDLQNTGLEEPGVKGSQLGLVLPEKHFSKYEYWFWDFYGTTRPSVVLTHEDVPVAILYERPPPAVTK